jgi:DnaJ domain
MAKPRSFDFEDLLRVKRPPPVARRCDMPDCACAGDFRAPKSRAHLTDYFWFCLDHVRAYNAAWDYYAGMSTAEIEAHLRADTSWQRPTWPLGGRHAQREGARDGRPRDERHYRFRDDFGLFDDLFDGGTRPGAETNRRQRPPQPQAKALALFDLTAPVSFVDVRVRYRELVKQHHPDANGGDKAAEERLKLINEAYVILRAWLLPA